MDRRKFLEVSALGAAGALFTGFTGAETIREAEDKLKESIRKSATRKQVFNMCNYAAPKIPTVRIGYVGIGARGGAAVTRILNIKNTQITALCDLREKAVKENQKKLTDKGLPAAAEYFGDDYSWKGLCERDDVDLVYISTPWKWHVPVATYAMECGKHAAVEVPAAPTLEGAWQLIETSERTRKHCVQLENMVYDFFELATLSMVQAGLLGELVHTDCAYIHDCLEGAFGQPVTDPKEEHVWRYKEQQKSGNLYPTHGLGPVSMALGINRGDRFDYMSSMSCNDFGLGPLAERLAKENDYYKQFTKLKFRGNTNTSIIRTVNGKTIMVQHDAASPRPYSRIHILSGTKGFVQKYPLPGKIAFGHEFLPQEKVDQLVEQYSPELLKHLQHAANIVGGHGGADFIMDWRLIDCLRNGLPMDMDVYDAAAWSSVSPLSVWSCANRSNSIDFPDFTCGSWKTNKKVDMSLRGGGDTDIAEYLKK